jgi:hypothetical protein
LVRDVKKRLGAKEIGGFMSIKSHSLFNGLDWTVIAEKKATPIFIPDVTIY